MKAKDGAVFVLAGVAAGALFVFAFPKSAITTLMHEVFRLPGPGAGIALVLGPWFFFFSLLAGRISRHPLAPFFASLCFGLTLALFALLGIQGESKGNFGGPLFLGGVILTGAVMSLASYVLRKKNPLLLGAASGALCGAVLLVYYWLVVFPRTTRWVAIQDVPVLLALGMAAGAMAGFLAMPAGGLLARRLGRDAGS